MITVLSVNPYELIASRLKESSLWDICSVMLFCNAPQAVELILQLLRSPGGNGSLQKKTKQNITTERMSQSVVKQVMTL